jgi:hypothetical protein
MRQTKKYSLLSIILLFLGTDFSYSQNLKNKPDLIIFESKNIYEKKELKLLSDSLKNEILHDFFTGDNTKDSLVKARLNALPDLYHSITNSYPENIVLEYEKNILWRYKKVNDTIIGDYESFNLNSNEIFSHPKKDRSKVYKTEKFPETPENVIIEKDITDTKEIYGYPCYKIRLRIENKGVDDGSDFNWGDEIYEMYVTDHIKLPLYSALYINIPDLPFPLEVIRWGSNFKRLKTSFKVIELK